MSRFPLRIANFVLVLFTSTVIVRAGDPDQGRRVDQTPGVLRMRDRVEAINGILVDRLDRLLPELMRETGIDMWLVINREYNEDPVYPTLVPEPYFAARRTTMLVFFDRGRDQGVERLTVSRYGLRVGDDALYISAWEGGSLDSQWTELAGVIAERQPKRIGINTSRHWSFADGLTAGLKVQLTAALGPELASRIVSAEALCVRWLETRTPMELEVYPHIVAIARSIIAEAFSDRVITPGVTTPADVSWYMRQRFEDLNLDPWFHPDVNIQRRGVTHEPNESFFGTSQGVIQRGDILHTDVGILYFRLATDTQEMGYVLKPGESDVPIGLERAFAVGNRWQDLLTKEFVTGRTGNQILEAALTAANREGIRSSVYSHPLGFFGHAAGPTIGMWDNQGPTPVLGDWPVHPNTAYAIEGNVKVQVPEWNDEWVQIKLEQSAVFDGTKVYYLAGRQTEWHIIH